MIHLKHFSFLILTLGMASFYACSNDIDAGIENDNEPNPESSAGCLNVVIVNGHAYAACENQLRIVNLATDERNNLAINADDITSDSESGLLFTQSGNNIQMLSTVDPMTPEVVATTSANFSIFSGLSAANGVLVVSGGSTNSDARVYVYSAAETSLELVTDGIPVVDNFTGAPDVHSTATLNGALGFYSLDLGNVANWGIQLVEFNDRGEVINSPQPPVVVLTSGAFGRGFGPFQPANFPLESEFLNNRLYVAHFAARGIEVIDLEDANSVSQIPLPYEPINIGTDGTSLFVLGIENENIDVIDPNSRELLRSIAASLEAPLGIAASTTHIAVADRSLGLVIVAR